MGQQKLYWVRTMLPQGLLGIQGKNQGSDWADQAAGHGMIRLGDCLYVGALVTALDVFGYFVLSPLVGMWACYVITFVAVSVIMVSFSSTVSQIHEQAKRRLRQQNRDLAILNEISRVASSSLELDAILGCALEKVLDLVRTEAGEILLLDDAGQELILKVHRGLVPEAFREITHFPLGDGIPGIIATSGKAIVVRNLAGDPRVRRTALVDQGFQTMACIPIRTKDQITGVLNVTDRHKSYTEDKVALLTAIGHQIGLAVENARLHSQVEATLNYVNAVIESLGDAIITTDVDGLIKSWNRGAEQIFGWTAKEVAGQFLPMAPETARDEVERTLARLRAGEPVPGFEARWRHKSGRLIWVEVAASPVYDAHGNLISLAAIVKDVSERKRLEAEIARQRQSLAVTEERERIAREMHDGLAQMMGYMNTKVQATQRCMTVGKATDAQAHLGQLENAVQEVYADVREAILGLRTPIAGEVGLLRTLKDYLHSHEQLSGIRTTLILEDPDILGDFALPVAVQLVRIIQEALTNVRKHSQASQVWLKFERAGDQAQITIQDNGRGFNQADLKGSYWPRFGLDTMRERAASMGGAIEIEAMPGMGTRIRVSLPLEAAPESA